MLAGALLLIVLRGGSVALFGLPGLYLPAVVLTPLMVALILRFTWG